MAVIIDGGSAPASGISDVSDLTTTGLTPTNYLRVANPSGLEERTPAQVLGDIGAADAATVATLEAGLIPADVGTLTATASGSAAIDLAWTYTAAAYIAGFKIERKTGVGGTYTQIGTANSGDTSYADSGLSAETTYYYRIRAYNNYFNSSYSNEANDTTSALDAPDSIANLFAWFDFSDLTTLFQDTGKTSPVTANGQAIAAVANKKSGGGDLAQATAGNRPVYTTNAINGVAAADFVASSSHYMGWSGAGAGANGKSVFVVYYPDGAASTDQRLIHFDKATGGAAVIISHLISGTAGRIGYYDSAFRNIAAATAVPQICSWQLGTGGTGEVFRAGSSLGSDVYTDFHLGNGSYTHKLSGNAPGGSFVFDGKIGEVVVYDRILNSTERQTVEAYLDAKWGF